MVDIPGKAASAVKCGTTEVVEAQKAVALCPAQANTAIGVLVQSDPNNTGAAVAVGDKNVSAKATLKSPLGVQLLKAGPPVFIETNDPSSLFCDVTTSKDCILWTILFA